MKKIVVTGGGGFLGSSLVKILTENKNYQVISLSRNHYSHLESWGVRQFKVDISQRSQLEQLQLDGVDVVFHTAALAGVWGKKDDYERINIRGTENILLWSRAKKVSQFIYTSSPSVVFGQDDLDGVDESYPYPQFHLCEYARTKRLAEELVLSSNSHDFITCALRPHLIWGPGDPHIIPRLLDKARRGRLKIVGDGNNLVDVIYVDNAAWAHVWAMEAERSVGGKAYFLGQEKPVKLWDFINQLLKLHDLGPVESKISMRKALLIGSLLEKVYQFLGIYSPEPPMTRFVALNLAKSHYFSQNRAKIDFNYSPLISIEDGLDEIKEEVQKRKKIIKG